MTNRGRCPIRIDAAAAADHLAVDPPPGAGDIRYFIEAEDCRGNVTRGRPGADLFGLDFECELCAFTA